MSAANTGVSVGAGLRHPNHAGRVGRLHTHLCCCLCFVCSVCLAVCATLLLPVCFVLGDALGAVSQVLQLPDIFALWCRPLCLFRSLQELLAVRAQHLERGQPRRTVGERPAGLHVLARNDRAAVLRALGLLRAASAINDPAMSGSR
jgi:hypothetical protein